MKGPLYLLLMASAALAALPAKANVYKCSINGETRYQDEPCPGARDAAPHLEFESSQAPAPGSDAPTMQAAPATPEDAGVSGVQGDRVPPPPVDDSPLDRTAQLGVEIPVAERELRAVVDERRAALSDIDIRMTAGGDNAALEAERKQIEASFRERRREAASRLAELKAELGERCPNGTFQNGRRLACR